MVSDYFVIDAHSHIYPEKIAAKAANATDEFYGVCGFGKGTLKDLKKVCKKAGVDHVVVQSVATTPKQVRSINEFISNEVKNAESFLTGLGTLHPESEDIPGDIEHIVELGLKGVKLHPDIQKFKIDGEKLFKIYEICSRKNLVMLMHTGDKRYDNSNPDRVERVLKNFPDLVVVGAHLGGWSLWEEAANRLNGFKNFYVDCSSSFGFVDNEIIKKAILLYGTDRVLFGTDYPMWNAEDEIKNLFSLGLSKEDNQKILSQNAKTLFGIE